MLSLLACSERGKFVFMPDGVKPAKVEKIFVATTRQKSKEDYAHGELRTSELGLLRYDVSIPQAHQLGQIEWSKARPNPVTDFLIADARTYASPAQFQSALKQDMKQRARPKDAIVFIHGYNTNHAEAVYRLAQVSTDMDIPSTRVLYSWPAAESTIEYLHDRDSVLFARDALEGLLHQLADAGAQNITLVAHSVGSVLLMETLRQMSLRRDARIFDRTQAVILISPDIDQTVFEIQLQSLSKIPKPFVVFGGQKDVALKVSSLLTGARNRLGQITDTDRLAKQYGLYFIDTTNFNDDDGDFLNHGTAFTSPSIIDLLRGLPAAIELTEKNGGNPETVFDRIFQTK